MQNFAKNPRAGSPLSNLPNSSRRQAGANAKVQVTKTTLTHDTPAPPRIRDEGQQSPRFVPQQQRHLQHKRPHASRYPPNGSRHNAYDTDAESLDTTLTRPSIVQVEDSQKTQHAYNAGGNVFDYGEDHESDDQSDKTDDENVAFNVSNVLDNQDQAILESFPDGNRQMHFELLKKMRRQKWKKYSFAQFNDMFGGDESYATTTSGIPEPLPGPATEGSLPELEDRDDRSTKSATPRKAKAQARDPLHVADRTIHRPASAAAHTLQQQNQQTLFREAADIRQQQSQSNPNFAHPGAFHQLEPMAGTTFAPPTTQQAQFNIQNSVSPVSMGATTPDEISDPKRSNPLRSTSQHIDPANNLYTLYSAPVGDYDPEVLFKMNYDQLQKEDFDMDPRAAPAVLSEDMLDKPLRDRLEYVHKSLDSQDQTKFFTSLSIHEWEDSGDWFLEKFGGILKRTKEARRTKRQVAKEFEEEIETRHNHVAKRQRLVASAKADMRHQGQGLLLKSPARSSRSPSRPL